MRRADRRQLAIGGGVALALVGLWLGHTIEYVRVWGTAGLRAELFGSIHAYMLPVGAALALIAGILGVRLWRLWSALGRRLDSAHRTLLALFRGHAVALPEPIGDRGSPSFWAGIAIAWPALTTLQIALYLLQENVEAVAAGVPAPGFGAVSGTHALAPAVHAAVALILVIAARAAGRLVRRRARAIHMLEAVARAVLRTLSTRAPAISAPAGRGRRAPLHLHGLHLSQRPPPEPARLVV